MSDIQIIEVSKDEIEILEVASVVIQGNEIFPSERAVYFSVENWVYENGYYYLEVDHYLESLDIEVTVLEDKNEVWADRWEPFSLNKIRLFIPADPDLRFAGRCLIKKIKEA